MDKVDDKQLKYKVVVTQLKVSKPFLKVFLRNITKRTEEFAGNLKYLYSRGSEAQVTLGEIYIASVSKDRYERCRVIQLNKVDRTATLMFIDCGYQGEISTSRLRLLQDEKLRNADPCCKEFILAGMSMRQNTPHKSIMNFHDMIVGNTFVMTILEQNDAGRFVDLRLAGKSLANELIAEHPELSPVFGKCPLEKQMSYMLQMKKNKEKLMNEDVMVTKTLLESPEIEKNPPDFEEERLSHAVRVTEFDDEPFCFFVQFTYNDVGFQQFQCGLQHFKDRLKTEKNVAAKTVVIAEIAGHLHRATVMQATGNVSKNEVKLELMETGHKCVVLRNQVFKIPDNMSIVPSFAKRFKLSGVDQLESQGFNVSEMEFYFKQITKQKLLTLKVVQENRDVVIPSCHLFLEDSSVLELCKRYDPHTLRYPKQTPVQNDIIDVIVSSVESPKKFFVQDAGAAGSLQFKAIEEALKHYEPPILRNPKPNNACVVKEGNSYKRGVISGHSTERIFKICLVDLGAVDEFNATEIKVSVQDLMTLPPLALRCCLSGFEDREEINEYLCEKFLRICKDLRAFQMKIVGRKAEYLIVELENPNDNRKLNDQLRDPAELNLTCWTDDLPSFNTHFTQKALERGDSFSDSVSIHTLAESPTKEKGNGLGDWQSIDDDLADLTVVPNLSESAKPSGRVEVKDWTPGRPWPFQFPDLSLRTSFVEEADGTLVASNEADRSNASLKLVSRRNSPLSGQPSTSGVSSSASELHAKDKAVIISSVASPTNFTIQKLCEAEAYKTHKANIQKFADAQAPLTSFAKESLCLAFHPFDRIWCRCVILDSDLKNFLVSVKCLDDGMTFTIENKSELKGLPPIYICIQSYGTNCSLPICYPLRKDSEVIAYLIKIRNDNLTCDFIMKFNDVAFIELFHQGKNVADTLIDFGLAKRLFVAPPGPALVHKITDSANFIIQMKSSMSSLEAINKYTEKYRHSDVADPKAGQLVLGYSKSDKAWHRARIVTVGKNSYNLYFIDYGSSEVVENIGPIDDLSIASMYPVAIRCSLHLPPGIKELTQLAEQKFKEIIAEQNNLVSVNMRQPGVDSAHVVLIVKGKNITHFLPIVNDTAIECQNLDEGCDRGF